MNVVIAFGAGLCLIGYVVCVFDVGSRRPGPPRPLSSVIRRPAARWWLAVGALLLLVALMLSTGGQIVENGAPARTLPFP